MKYLHAQRVTVVLAVSALKERKDIDTKISPCISETTPELKKKLMDAGNISIRKKNNIMAAVTIFGYTLIQGRRRTSCEYLQDKTSTSRLDIGQVDKKKKHECLKKKKIYLCDIDVHGVKGKQGRLLETDKKMRCVFFKLLTQVKIRRTFNTACPVILHKGLVGLADFIASSLMMTFSKRWL